MKKERKSYIDVIKILAVFLVCFAHSGSSGSSAFYASVGITQIIQTTIFVICIKSVPLFFMCTGALLLLKEEGIRQLWVKRVIRYIVLIVVFTTLYYVCLSIRNQTPVDILFILKTMYNTWGYSHSGSYWFLYYYVGFLMLLPLLRMIAKGLDNKMITYMIIVNTVMCSVLPIVESWLGMENVAVKVELITADVFFYPFLGCYIEKSDFKEIFTPKNIVGLLVMSIVSLVTSVSYSISYIQMGIYTDEYYELFQLYVVMFVYIMAKWLNGKFVLNERVLKVLTEVSNCTFGIYLIHGVIYMLVDDLLVAKGVVFTYPIAWLRAGMVFSISLICVWICRKIPGIKRLF